MLDIAKRTACVLILLLTLDCINATEEQRVNNVTESINRQVVHLSALPMVMAREFFVRPKINADMRSHFALDTAYVHYGTEGGAYDPVEFAAAFAFDYANIECWSMLRTEHLVQIERNPENDSIFVLSYRVPQFPKMKKVAVEALIYWLDGDQQEPIVVQIQAQKGKSPSIARIAPCMTTLSERFPLAKEVEKPKAKEKTKGTHDLVSPESDSSD